MNLLSKGNLNPIFSFLPSYINYILKNVSPLQLLKLYQSCKYFYCRLKASVAADVTYGTFPQEQRISFSFGSIYDLHNNVSFGGLFQSYNYNGNKLWLCGALTIHLFTGRFLQCGPIGNNFLNKIYRNNLKELCIYGGYILFKELEILSKSPYLTKVTYDTIIKNDDGELMIFIEDIMALFPNIEYLETTPSYFTKESFQKLSKFKFKNKIKLLHFWRVQSEFDPISLCDFLEENCDDNANFHISFGTNFQLKAQLLPQVKELINSWETIKLKHFLW